jgi:GNAT superfamily N-acetyltransferase
MDVRTVPADQSPARELIAAMIEELIPLYGRIDGPGAPTATAADFAPPGGTFLVLERDGVPVAGGGLKRLDAATCEIKRMFVIPEARGQGVARALLQALEGAARELGYTNARLDTGPEQPHAKALYESAGYVEIPDYNANPHASFWAERAL